MNTAPPRLLPDAGAPAEALINEARRHQHRRYILIGLAAVAMLAGAAGVTVSQIRSGSQPPGRAVSGSSFAGVPASYSSAPAYYAYAVSGDIYDYFSQGTLYSGSVPGRYLKIRDTGTGKLLARISPPKPYNDFTLLTADANGRTFVVAAIRYWDRGGNYSAKLAERTLRTPMTFLLLHIAPGHQVRRYGLTLPEALTPGQLPSIALSPDGTRLAVAFGGDGRTRAVEVITLATGSVRRWVLPHASWTPSIDGNGAWTANGRTLAFQQWLIPRRPVSEPASEAANLASRRFSDTHVFLLDTTAPGAGLASSRLLVLRPPAGESPAVESALARPIITPDGTKLIGAVREEAAGQLRNGSWTGELAVYSAQTGALLRTVAPWVWRWHYPPGADGYPEQFVTWSNRSGSQLIVLQPRDHLNVLGLVTGNTFTPAGGNLLPQASGYQELQHVLRTSAQMTW